MIAFPSMLAGPAKDAGMKLPADIEDFDPVEFPHWQVYLNIQLGSPLPYPSAHWDNAKAIASVPDDQIMQVTGEQLFNDYGVVIGYSK